jgi:hypothetical protein
LRTALLVASLVLTIAPVATAAPAETARGIGVYGSFFSAPAPKNALSGQITAPNAPRKPLPAPPATTTSPSVVCGMTLIPANPAVDRAMKRATPTDRQFTIRAVEPTVCRRR